MTNQLDQVSLSIGELKQGQIELNRTFERHCVEDSDRHRKNLQALRENNKAIGELAEVLKPLAKTVAAMQPIVESMQTSRIKFAGAMGVVFVLMGFVGWLIDKAISGGIEWFLGRH